MQRTEVAPEWGLAVAAARMVGCPPRQIRNLARNGLISVRHIPGCEPRYSLADAERLARQYTRVATRAEPAGAPPPPESADAPVGGGAGFKLASVG
jgi:hypothetical protein